MDFSELDLSPEVLQAVSDAGYTNPTPIQEQAIPHVKRGRDVLGCAQTGTGKTASFVLPMVDMLAAGRARVRMPRSLILEPTRELATQVAASFELYGKHHRLTMALLIGGESFVDQERKLDRGVDVLIATPGRLLDLYGRGKILLSDTRILVIDEADRMLDMGFIPDVERIVGLLPETRQTLFFSATMPAEIRKLADAFLRNPIEVSVAPPASPAALVAQSIAVVDPRDKREALRRLIRSRRRQERADLLQPQARCRHSVPFAGPARVRRRGIARRHAATETHGNPGPLSERRNPASRGQRRRRARLGHQRHEPRLLFRRADPRRGLRPPHRPNRPRRPRGPVFHARLAGGRRRRRRDRQVDRPGNSADCHRGYRGSRTRIWRASRRAAGHVGPSSPIAAAPEPMPPPEAPRGEPAEPRAPRRERRPSAKEAAQQDLPASNVTSFPRAPVARVPRRPERQPEPDRQVVGFGDHLPAFLARPPRIVARP